jgi:CubicO group peptidase (beta-lactamase class C family)
MIAVFAKLLSMKRIAIALLLSVTALCNTFGAGVTSKPESFSELQSAIETVLKETKTPGAAVVIVSREKMDWLAGVGKADVAANKPVTPETLFRIGSVSKSFAALAALTLPDYEARSSVSDS